ncbi:unnamed protein product [Rotaria magnacalcarata]|uniref:Equilibrative nucleoside transporter 4 n=1 Tax=Rotaria magnacalcarata TaxID=392030 RepID=A0A816BM25_9BILA|nr:unnamed protein product [Rotaria magnacalcarata]CAF1612263.1 unnamed protein product [Rotaria magnacalcarata]CAF2042409.1 unnamed protein product [Rotaria magnacalcarata]CAF3848479.1 unnamed protein product [Rotaria magnacalcarata]CAF3915329.1 unnamed protein product [Rotaria magnacalcarata]
MDENFLRNCYVIRNSEQKQQQQQQQQQQQHNHRYVRFDDHRSFTEQQPQQQQQLAASPPIDKYHFVYLGLFCCGIGFLLPYSIYITCVDYFHTQFPQTAIIFHLNFIYIIVAFSTVVFSNIIANVLSVKRRVIFGYCLTLVILMFITIFCVGLEVFPQQWSYCIFLLSVGIIAIGCTLQQSSFYGLTSMLPFRYTQAVMTGESFAGLLASCARISTNLFMSNDSHLSTILFFSLGLLFVQFCFISYLVIQRSKFIEYYVYQCENAKKNEDIEFQIRCHTASINSKQAIVDDNEENLESNPSNIQDLHFGILTVDTFDDQQQPIISSYDRYSLNLRLRIKREWYYRVDCIRIIWPYMISIACTYLVTLSLFPGVESEMINCQWREWLPIILMALFNTFDVFGKIFALFTHRILSPMQLFVGSLLRLIYIPLMLLCILPKHAPLLSNLFWQFFFSSTLGLTNGYFGSVPMIRAPVTIIEERKELTGNLMMFSYSIGLTVGSLLSYLLDAIIGQSTGVDWCQPVSSLNQTIWAIFHNSNNNSSIS